MAVLLTVHAANDRSAFAGDQYFTKQASGLMRGLATLFQGNQDPLVVKDNVGRPPGELGVSKSMECDTFPLQCFDTVGWVTGRASGL